MSEGESTLNLIEIPEGYLLSRKDDDGQEIEFKLSEMDVLKFAQSAHFLKTRILSKLQLPGLSAEVRTPVISIRLDVALHGDELLLDMIDPSGIEQCFLLPLDIASALTDRLPDRVAEMMQAVQGRRCQ